MNQYRFMFIAIYLFILPLGFTLFICYIFSRPPNLALPPFLISSLNTNFSNILPNQDQDINFRTILIEAAHLAFINYFTNCINHDEFRPISKKCLDNYGFSVSLFESLETLYILNMTNDFQKAKNYIMNFSFDNRGFINVHEFWSRGIASLIGAYQLSGDISFLFKASQLADQVLYREKNDFINIKLGESSSIATGKHFLSNWLSGVPEIMILNEFIQAPCYIEYIKREISRKSDIFIYPQEFTKKHTYEPIFNFLTTSFIKNANLVQKLLSLMPQINIKEMKHDYQSKSDFIDKSKKLLKHFKITKKTRLSELTLASQLLSFRNIFPPNLLDNLENEERYGDVKNMFGFQFKGDEIFDLSRRGEFDIVKKTITNSLQKYKTKTGFNGITSSSIGNKYPDDIQHTEFLGEWLKVGAMISCGYQFLFQTGIFNEYNHILKILY